MQQIAGLSFERDRARIYEHGWQSWSPTAGYAVDASPYRPTSENRRLMNYRPDRDAPGDAFWGEGLLAVDPGDGEPVHVFAAPEPCDVPSIRVAVAADRLLVSADGPVEHIVDGGPGGLYAALARWADGFAAVAGVGQLRPAPTLWCSWYHYFTAVTEADVDENVRAIDDLGLDIDVVQIDDGYRAEIGDWLVLSDRFRSLRDTVARIRDRGRRAGIWVAPFLIGHDSQVFRDHQDRLLDGVPAGWGWGQDLAALDAASPGGEGYLRRVFSSLRESGFDVFKLDFLYAGALPGPRAPGTSGLEAYRHGLRVIRESVGPESFLLGCGARCCPASGWSTRCGSGRTSRTGSTPRTATSPSPLGARPPAPGGSGPGSTAGSGSTTPTACSRPRQWRSASSGPRTSRSTAGCGPAATGSPTSTSGVWPRPAG